jgi:hypothetical protein
MPLQKLAVQNLDDINQQRRRIEVLNQVLDHSFDDSRKQTNTEKLAGITPINPAYHPGDVRRYKGGSLAADGTEDWTDAIQSALDTGEDVHLYTGHYLAANLTQTVDFQRMYAHGEVKVEKNANGPIITSDGDYFEIFGVAFRGDDTSPTFTGDGLVLNGDHPRLVDCGVRWIIGAPVKAIGQHVQILGTCDLFQTTTDANYDIEIGVSGTATLYHQVSNIYTSRPGGGLKFIDCGGHAVMGSQFGKLLVEAGTLPAGVNGGTYTANRINGDITVEISNSAFSANAVSAVAVTFASGTSGHSFGASNVVAAGATVTDDSNGSVILDARDIPYKSYAATIISSGGDFAKGDGVIVSYYSRRGKEVTVFFRFVVGATTTIGTGFYTISLPTVPNTTFECLGTAEMFDTSTSTFRIGCARSLSSGTAIMRVSVDSSTSFVGAATPFAWAVGDEWRIGLTYFED